jgi:serine/threonine protein kinase
MAPEQAAGKIADARSDLFSIGVVIYEMLAGANPFARESAVASMNAVAHDVLPSLSLVRKDLPLGLVRLVESLLAKSPMERPESASKALDAFLSIDLQGKQNVHLEELLPPSPPVPKSESKSGSSGRVSGPKLASFEGERASPRQVPEQKNEILKDNSVPDWLKVGILTFSVILSLCVVAILLRRWLG